MPESLLVYMCFHTTLAIPPQPPHHTSPHPNAIALLDALPILMPQHSPVEFLVTNQNSQLHHMMAKCPGQIAVKQHQTVILPPPRFKFESLMMECSVLVYHT